MENPFTALENRLTRIERLIRDVHQKIEEHQPIPPEQPVWLTVDDLCAYLPDKPKPPTIYQWVRERRVPFHKSPGQKRLRFLRSEIDQWLRSQRQKTLLDVDGEADKYLGMRKISQELS